MRTVWKIPLEIEGDNSVTLPEGVNVVHIDTQGDDIMMWVLVEPVRVSREYRFFVVATGGEVPRNTQHVGTVLTNLGKSVWHVFAEMPD